MPSPAQMQLERKLLKSAGILRLQTDFRQVRSHLALLCYSQDLLSHTMSLLSIRNHSMFGSAEVKLWGRSQCQK